MLGWFLLCDSKPRGHSVCQPVGALDERIITVQPSQLDRESPDMRENRHDQTILSLLLKKWGAGTRSFPSGPVYNWQKKHREGRKARPT